MENEKNTPQPEDTGWLDQWLADHSAQDEIGPDESALSGTGLTDISDMALEKIMQEAASDDWSIPEPEPEAVLDLDLSDEPAEDPVEEMDIGTEAPEEAAEEEESDGPVRKVRPKRKKGYGLLGIPHILSIAILVAIVLFVGSSLGNLLWICASDILAFGREDKTVTITISASDDLESVAKKLYDAELIKYPRLFIFYGDITSMEEDGEIVPGTYELNTLFDYHALAKGIGGQSAVKEEVEIMIPEGYTCAQIFALLEKKGVCSAADLEAYAANGELDRYWFLDGIERGHKYCLEGFLFPDTYEFYMDDEPKRVIEKFLDAFDYRFTDRMIAKFVDLNKNLGLDLSIREVVTMASIVEKEKASSLEGYSIASVFYNRLTHAASYPYLNSDATLLYDVDYYTGRIMTEAEKSASPYNTYTQTGLPAGPIANPGLSSLDAALAPETTDYFFFIYDKNAGQHRFSRTLAEHEQLARELGY